MTIRQELFALHQADPQHILHPKDVVDWARDNPQSYLFKALQWDDLKAANEYRLSQARHLIVVHVVSNEGAPLVVSLSIDRSAGGGYRAISDLEARPDLQQVMMQDALAELERFRIKYARVEALAEVWAAAAAARERTARMAARKAPAKGRATARAR